VILGRIFSCSHDRDHLYPHIQTNFHTGSYAKHAIHPPKINTPNFLRDFSSCILAKGERGYQWKKSICSKCIEKKCAPIKEHRENEADPLQNKNKRRISKQGVDTIFWKNRVKKG
jgi:hypothetical protein